MTGNGNIPKDPYILLSYVNTKLRDDFDSLESLCEDLGVEKAVLVDEIGAVGYDYDPKINRFRVKG